MRWQMNGMLSDGGPLSFFVDDAKLLDASVRAIQKDGKSPQIAAMSASFIGGDGKDNPDEDGWLLVVPDDEEGTQIAEALAPLIAHRIRLRNPSSISRQRTAEEVVKRFPASAMRSPALGDWDEKNVHCAPGDDSELPFYVLIAGPPSKIPFELEYLISRREQCVGRIAFPDLASYAAYARKIIAWEPDDDAATTPRSGLPVAFFATDHGSRDPTFKSRHYLAEPIAALLRKDPTRRGVARFGADATRDALVDLLRGADGLEGPQLLFSASHGLAVGGAGADARQNRLAKQGPVCCQDAKYTDDEILPADALPDGPLLAGGMWLLFACFGAGTPSASDFFRALDDRTLLGMHDGGPFVAALPTRLLASPDGPLAIIGHVDPGFVHAFSDPGGPGGERRKLLQNVVDRLAVRGTRAGVATSRLGGAAGTYGEQYFQLEAEISRSLGNSIVGASHLKVVEELAAAAPGTELDDLRRKVVDTTVSRQDLRNFVILGDPAAKLPRKGAQPATAASAPTTAVTASVAAPPAPVAAPPAPEIPTFLVEAQSQGRLVLTCSEKIFAPEGVELPPGNAIVVALIAEPCADVRDRPSEEETADGGKQRYYEAIEHQDCDLLAELRFSADEVWPAPAHRLTLANGIRLRYGEAISLFGDFYGIPGLQVASGEDAFLQIFATLDRGDAAELRRILGAMAGERAAVTDAQTAGTRVADAYARVGGALNGEYNRATGGGSIIHALFPQGRYLRLAAANYDHFGRDARDAYRAAHGAACREAGAARAAAAPEDRRRILARAYTMNACADHFLTDLFASGHLRVPRHALAKQITIKLVGDLLSKRMHDEDNARGLKVKNGRGDEWVAYGDKLFHDDVNERGRTLAREAVRASAAEVWSAFDTGVAPAFEALRIVPDLEDALSRTDNRAPLFIEQGGVLKRRKNLFDLGSREWTADFTGIATLLRGAVDDLVGKHTH